MSGYYPIRKAAYDEQLDKDWVAKYPQFSTAVDQLHATNQPRHPRRPDRCVPHRPPDGRKRDRRSTGRQGHSAGSAGSSGASVTAAIEEYNISMGLAVTFTAEAGIK